MVTLFINVTLCMPNFRPSTCPRPWVRSLGVTQPAVYFRRVKVTDVSRSTSKFTVMCRTLKVSYYMQHYVTDD